MHLLLFATVPLIVLNKLTQIKCIMQPFVIGTLLLIITAITMTKTLKALHAFQSNVLISKRSVTMTRITEWFILFIIAIVQIIICAISFFQASSTTATIRNRELIVKTVYCTNQTQIQIQLGYIFLLSLFCLIQAFRGRHLPGRFNESLQTTHSMLFAILILGINFPITQSLMYSTTRGVVIVGFVTVIIFIQLIAMHSFKIFVNVISLRAKYETIVSIEYDAQC